MPIQAEPEDETIHNPLGNYASSINIDIVTGWAFALVLDQGD